jgi:hypothetical protein
VAVLADGEVSAADAPLLLADLYDKSLIATEVGDKVIHYRLFETARAYARERLAESGDGPAVALRHARYFLDLMRRADSEWNAERGGEWLSVYRGDIDDVRAAIQWSLAPGGEEEIGLELTVASAQLWFQLSLMPEYREHVERALRRLEQAAAPQPSLEMRLQMALGYCLWYTVHEPGRVQRAFARAGELAVQCGDRSIELQALWGMWAGRRGRGEYRAALDMALRYEAVADKAGDLRLKLLGDRILGLTYHYLGEQERACRLMESVRATAHASTRDLNTDFQYHPEVATTVILARAYWIRGYPDLAMRTAQEGVDAAIATGHGLQVVYVMMHTACILPILMGDHGLARERIEIMMDHGVGNPHAAKWSRCYELVMKLLEGSERDALIASHILPRADLATMDALSALAFEPALAVPAPSVQYGDAEWSLPELLRVDGEILRWRGGQDAAAEEKLLESREVARRQSALSWELRSAMSLARLWREGGRAGEGRDLVAATLARFSEGFGTADLVAARRLVSEPSRPVLR